MNFKRLISGVCAFSIAVTQTAIVPMSVSAVDYTEVPGFTDQFSVTLCANSTTGTAEWDFDAWDGIDGGIDPSSGKAVLNSSTMAKSTTPDSAKDVRIAFSCLIDDGYYQPKDEFDFTVYDLTLTLTKNPSDMVKGSEESVSSGGRLTADEPITVGAYAKAVKGSTIKVTYSADTPADEESEVDPALDIMDANGSSISDVLFDKDKDTFEITLDENTAASVAENGFKVVGKDVTVTDISVSIPDYSPSGTEPQTEVLSNAEKHEWTVTRNSGGWFDGNLFFTPEKITISDFKDFFDNCSVTAEWSNIECKSKRPYYESANSELWSGNKKFQHSWEDSYISLPAFDKAAKDTRLTVEYTVTPPTDEELAADENNKDGHWTPTIGFINNAIDDEHPNGKWKNLMDLHPDQDDEWGNIELDKNSTSITVTLTEEAAKALNDGVMFINGCDITVTAVKSLDADPNPTEIALNAENFPNETFLGFIRNFDKNGDGKLNAVEIGKIRSIEFNEENADEIYRTIDDFTGIEYLFNLNYVNIRSNEAVKTLDVSKCSKLECLDAGGCTNLEKAVLPDGIKEIYLYNTSLKEISTENFKDLEVIKVFGSQITSIDVSKNTKLKELDVSSNKLEGGIDVSNCPELTDLRAYSCGLEKLDVSNNKKLEILNIGDNSGIEIIGIEKLTTLKELYVYSCGLEKLDISKNKSLEKLDVNNNALVALDLTGMDALTEYTNEYQKPRDITVLNNMFDLSELSKYGLDPAKVTIDEDQQAVLEDGIIVFEKNAESVTYSYDTGLDSKHFKAALYIKEKLKSKYAVSYMDGKKTVTTPCDSWEDALKLINNKNVDYTIIINASDTIDKLTFPTAAKAKSITLGNISSGERVVITTNSSSVSFPTDVTLRSVYIESTAKNFTITASKNLTLDSVTSKTLKTLKGSSKYVLKYDDGHENNADYDISGFGTVEIGNSTDVDMTGTVKASTLKLNGGSLLFVNDNSVTFANVEVNSADRNASIVYSGDNFRPVAVTGSIKLAEGSNKLMLTKYDGKFSADAVLLTSKTANLANIRLEEDSVPDDNVNYALARVGSNVVLMAAKLELRGSDESTIKYAQWSDILNTIAANAKAGNKDTDYTVTLLDDYDIGGAFKMPAANTFGEIIFNSNDKTKTLSFTGNISLTGKTFFENVKLNSMKKSKTGIEPAEFSISAGKNYLGLSHVSSDAAIKNVTSSNTVSLDSVTIGSVNAADIIISKTTTSEDALGALADGSNEFVSKAIAESSVTVTGNLTAKGCLGFIGENASLTVKGIINAVQIGADTESDLQATLVVYRQAKGKNALVIGKSGFAGFSKQIMFVLADPSTDMTAQITAATNIGTIAGPYADQLVPCTDSLAPNDDYYIIKDGKNLVAVPKNTESGGNDLVKVGINGRTAYYKSLDDAIKDINATGSKDDTVTITLTQDMFSKPIAKLPLPSAGKYGQLTLTADSDVTINITGDIALTGDLAVRDKISINKVKVTGKGDKATTEIVPVSINVGKYYFITDGKYSADPKTGANRIANISGSGTFHPFTDTVVTGKVNGTSVIAFSVDITLDGKNAAFAGGIVGQSSTFTFDKSISKNVKFKDIGGEIKLVIKDGDNKITVSENDIIASVTGDYTGGYVTVNDSELKIVRSGNNLKAVKSENVVGVHGYSGSGSATRMYDSLSSVMNDISRIKDKDMNYRVYIKDKDVLVLPKANTYDTIFLESENQTPVVITTAKDLTLTGNLSVGQNVTVNKADGKAMSVNLNNYGLSIDENAYIAYDAENKVSRFVNISGKGIFWANENITVSGKVNVGTFSALNTTLGERSSFSAALIEAYEGDELNYPVKIAKNVKFGGFFGETLTVNVSGLEKPNTQIASFTGSYIENFIQIGDGDTYTAVPSGNKLMAVAKADAKTVAMTVSINDEETTYLFDTYENAVKAAAKLGSADAELVINVTDVQPANGKLTLPTKGKYKTLELYSSEDVVIKLKSDVALTGDLVVSGKITLRKNNGGEKDILKFTTNAKDNFTVTVKDDANIINGKLVIGKNMTDIRNPDGQ